MKRFTFETGWKKKIVVHEVDRHSADMAMERIRLEYFPSIPMEDWWLKSVVDKA